MLSFGLAGCDAFLAAHGEALQPCTAAQRCVAGLECFSGQCLATEDLTSAEVTWVPVPSGSFRMGCDSGDVGCSSIAQPARQVTVVAFEITETEITQAQYAAQIGAVPTGHGLRPGWPADNVTWIEASAFCEGIGGRLPSEAEWEYASRAGSNTLFTCGQSSTCLEGVAWFGDNALDETHRVASKAANAFGLYDMTGNLWEWVADCLHEGYAGAPSTSVVWNSSCIGDSRIVRGASYDDDIVSDDLYAFARDYDSEAFGDINTGFRCARSPR